MYSKLLLTGILLSSLLLSACYTIVDQPEETNDVVVYYEPIYIPVPVPVDPAPAPTPLPVPPKTPVEPPVKVRKPVITKPGTSKVRDDLRNSGGRTFEGRTGR